MQLLKPYVMLTMKMVENLPAFLCVILLHHLTAVSSRGNKVVNLAVRKPASQSSTHSTPLCNGSAELAVDGIAINYFDNGSCSHTDIYDIDVMEAWWEVYLQSYYRVGNIKILNRVEKSERLHDVRIDVYDSERRQREGKHCTTHAGQAGSDWLNLTCDPSVTGRYVRITKPMLTQDDPLSLCEVEIYQALEKNRSMYFKSDSMITASGQGQEFTARSPHHCGSICAWSTPACKGFDFTRQEDGRIRCHVAMKCPHNGGSVKMDADTTFYHLCW